MLRGLTVSVVVDETTGDRSKSVVNVLFVKQPECVNDRLKPILVEVKYVDEVNAAAIGRIVIKTLTTYGVEYDHVTALVSDNAAYMTKAFREHIGPLCENSVHVTCVAHTVNLVGSTMQEYFELVDKLVACMKKAFRLSSGKRSLFKEHLEQCGVQDAKTPPAPVKTRWNSWINAVLVHSSHFEHYPSLLKRVQERYRDAAEVGSLLKLLDRNFVELKYTMRCIAVFGRKIAALLEAPEGQRVACHKAYDALFTLWGYLKAAAQEDFERLLLREDVSKREASEISRKLKTGMGKAAEKAEAYLEKSKPWKFFKSIRCLDPLQIKFLSQNREEYSNIPGLADHSSSLSAEWQLYLKTASDLKASDRPLSTFLSKEGDCTTDFDVLGFWVGMKALTPILSCIALRYLSVPINSVDAERSFSQYSDIVSKKRHGLTEECTKHLLVLRHNSSLCC
ncbi:uncharacterized protein LOC135378539 [Ornithodoros turicata]|uniref:uncharacterized protein LOC135378539 n=1 Tax=Ornithodoros turicata TaxID=34597 RepID=UPI003139EDB0